MKRKTKLENCVASATTMMVLALLSTPVSAGNFFPESHRQDVTVDNETWHGDASCTIECADGECKQLAANCVAAASYEDAKRQLTRSLTLQAVLSGGKIQGSITFSIRKSF